MIHETRDLVQPTLDDDVEGPIEREGREAYAALYRPGDRRACIHRGRSYIAADCEACNSPAAIADRRAGRS